MKSSWPMEVRKMNLSLSMKCSMKSFKLTNFNLEEKKRKTL